MSGECGVNERLYVTHGEEVCVVALRIQRVGGMEVDDGGAWRAREYGFGAKRLRKAGQRKQLTPE